MGLSLALSPVWADASASKLPPAEVHFSRTQFQMGESTTLYIRGENIEPAFTPAIVKQLKKYLMIFKVAGDEDSVRVTLYPQKVGRFTFPAIDAGRIQLPPQSFNILPNPEVQVTWQQDSDPLFEHQTLNWKVIAHFSEPTYHGKLHLFEEQEAVEQGEQPQVERPGYRALSNGVAVAERTMEKGAVERLFVAAYSFKQAGTIRAVNPYLEVKNRSQRPWRFFPYPDRHHVFHVKPLPSYLPPNLPVGELKLEAKPLKPWIESGDLVNWSLTLSGISLPATDLPSLDNQLVADAQVQWLANRIQKSEQFTPQGFISQAQIDQPLRFLSWGQHSLPEIRLLSFNPATQKVQTTVLPAQTLWVFPAGLGILAKFLVFLLGISLLSFSIWGLTLQQQYKRWIEQVQRAETPQQLWCALQNCMHWMLDKTETPCDEMQTTMGAPIEQAFQAYHTALSKQTTMPEWAEALNQQLFAPDESRNEADFLALKHKAHQWCKQQTVWQKIRYQLFKSFKKP